MQNLSELLTSHINEYSEKIALQIREGDGWRKLSFRQLHDSSEALARYLHSQGVGHGNAIALLSENRPEWGIAFFAILRASAIVVPIDKLLKKDEIHSILERIKPKWITTSGTYSKLAGEVSNRLQILTFDEGGNNQVTLAEALEAGAKSSAIPQPTRSNDSVAVMIFTSGTTGHPKGVMLSHRNFISNVESFYKLFPEHFFQSNFLSILPLNHAFELTGGFLTPIYGGGTVTYLSSLKPSHLLETMREAETEIMLTVPAVLDLLRRNLLDQIRRSKRQLKRFTFASHLSALLPFPNLRRGLFAQIHEAFGGRLRYFVSGGAPLAPDLQAFFERLGFEVIQGYGLTETSPVLAVNPLHRTRKNSVGKPLPGVEIKIRGEREGEIVAKGANIMKGYYEDPHATNEVIKEGYLCTGDLGYFDDAGYLYISGRLKNLIVSSAGKKVSPEEIEEKLSKLPFVKEVCVLGRKSGLEEEVVAIVAADQDRLKADAIPPGEVRARIWEEIKKVNASIAEFKRVRDLILWDGELPKTTTMKVKRRELEQLMLEKIKTRIAT